MRDQQTATPGPLRLGFTTGKQRMADKKNVDLLKLMKLVEETHIN